MPTLLIKNVSDELLRRLKGLKVELGCRTGSELLEKLARLAPREFFTLNEDDLRSIESGVEKFLDLTDLVSEGWSAPPSVLGEFKS